MAHLEQDGRSSHFPENGPAESMVRGHRIGDQPDLDPVPGELTQRAGQGVPIRHGGRKRPNDRTDRLPGPRQFEKGRVDDPAFPGEYPRRLRGHAARKGAVEGTPGSCAERFCDEGRDLGLVAVEQLEAVKEEGRPHRTELLRFPAIPLDQTPVEQALEDAVARGSVEASEPGRFPSAPGAVQEREV